MRAARIGLRTCLLVGGLALGSGCSPATAVLLRVYGADVLGGDRVRVEGSVDGNMVHQADVPDTARPLSALEDLRIVLADDLADKVIHVDATVLRSGVALETQSGGALIVLHKTKALYLYFSATAEIDMASASDGGSPVEGGAGD